MSSETDETKGGVGYRSPSLATEIFATFVGLMLVYGMITLIGNASRTADALAVSAAAPAPAAGVGELGELARGKLGAFLVHKEPQALPEFGFLDEAGRRHTLADFRGKVVLLNLWATWCGPCRHEMPAFDEIKRKFAGQPFDMLAISIDRGGLKKPRRFFDEIGIRNLTLYGDEDGRLAPLLKSFAMPTTLLIDAQGRELGRIAGPAEWASDDALALIAAAIKQVEAPRDRL